MGVGDGLVAWGKVTEAEIAYCRYRDVVADKYATNPSSTEWQRDLSVSYERIGGVQVAQDNLDAAWSSYADGLRISRNLSTSDPTNVQVACDVVVGLYKLARTAPKALSVDKAIACLEEGREILVKLDQQVKLTSKQKSWFPSFEERLN